MHRLDRVLVAPAPHTKSVSAILPCNIDPWPIAENRASTDGHPTYGDTSRNLGQTSNSTPIVLNSRSISSPPIISMAGGKPSVPVVSVPSNAGGQTPHDLCYPLVELLLIIDRPLVDLYCCEIHSI